MKLKKIYWLKMNFIKDMDIRNKRVLIRVDYNVPIQNGKISNDFRIRQSLETIKYCLSNNASVVLMSHLGRPKGVVSEEYSLELVSWHLEELIKTDVMFVNDCISDNAFSISNNLKPQEVLLLENLRFYNEEVSNDDNFSKKISNHADVFINDAFGTAHRSHASNIGVLSFFKEKGYGFLINKEIQYLKNELENPKKPLLVIIGGAKISTKIALINHLVEKADIILVGGAMAFTFQKALGYNVGNSLVENEELSTSLEIIKKAKRKNVNLQFPVDVVCAKDINKYESIEVKSIDHFENDDIGLDIGPETCINYQMFIESAKTIVWNGPLGFFEIPYFSTGTQSIAISIEQHGQKNNITTIIGGGDTVSAIDSFNSDMKFTHISTGGGSSLELLSGKKLPALKEIDIL